MCTGTEESFQRATARKTQNQSSEISEKAARKIGKDEETLAINIIVQYSDIINDTVSIPAQWTSKASFSIYDSIVDI